LQAPAARPRRVQREVFAAAFAIPRLDHFFHSSESRSNGMNTPPTTERALKANLFAVGGFVPISKRNARRRLVHPAIGRRDQPAEVVVLFGEAGGPDDPIELRVRLAVVERQTVGIQLRQTVGDFRAGDLRREQVVAQQTVPDQVVLLAPCAGLSNASL